jgi:hypothetical protein
MAQPPVPVPPDETIAPRFRRSVSRAPRRHSALLVLLGLLVAAVAGWYVFTRTVLVFTNDLAGSVRLAADEEAPVTVAPGASIRITAPRGRAMVALWELVRPLSADGRPMGSEMRGSVVIRGASGTVRRSARARGGDSDYFAPLITNASEDLLRLTVNAGLEGSLDCGCAVRPAASRVFIGYYPLFQNSTVRARSGDGRSATFRDLGSNVTRPDGTLGLRFDARDLR